MYRDSHRIVSRSYGLVLLTAVSHSVARLGHNPLMLLLVDSGRFPVWGIMNIEYTSSDEYVYLCLSGRHRRWAVLGHRTGVRFRRCRQSHCRQSHSHQPRVGVPPCGFHPFRAVRSGGHQWHLGAVSTCMSLMADYGKHLSSPGLNDLWSFQDPQLCTGPRGGPMERASREGFYGDRKE